MSVWHEDTGTESWYPIAIVECLHLIIIRRTYLMSLWSSRKLMPVHRLTMNRLLPLTSEWSAADGNLEVALQHLDLHRFVPLMDVLQAVGRMKGQTRRLQRTVRWHEARRLEVADKYGLTWLQHGTAHAKGLTELYVCYLMNTHLFD